MPQLVLDGKYVKHISILQCVFKKQPGINQKVGGMNCNTDIRDKANIVVTANIFSMYLVQRCDDNVHNACP